MAVSQQSNPQYAIVDDALHYETQHTNANPE